MRTTTLVKAGVISIMIFGLEVAAGLAQDPCADPKKAASELILRDLLTKKTLAARKAVVENGKQFLELKYDDCPDTKEFGAYLKTNLPLIEKGNKEIEAAEAFKALLVRFDAGMKSENWDEVYAAGKLILAEKPNEYIDIEIVLGSIGLMETGKNPRVTKWNDETITFARQAILDMEAGKPFKTYGLGVKDGANFVYHDKNNAMGWMNYAIGYIYFFDKNDKRQAATYLYRASQLNSDTRSDPIVYESIGGFYLDEVQRLAKEIKDLVASQGGEYPPEIAKQNAEQIKMKPAILNGTTEAAMDAYARAYALAKDKPARYPKTYTDGLYKKVQDLYDVRFGKAEGLDTWIAGVNKKPMPDPSQPVTPVSEPEPVAASTPLVATAPAKASTTSTSKTTVKQRSKKKVIKKGH